MSHIVNLSDGTPRYVPCELTREDSRFHTVPADVYTRFTEPVSVQTGIRLEPLVDTPTDPFLDQEGGFYYNSATKRINYKTDTAWVPVISGAADIVDSTDASDLRVARWKAGKVTGSLASISDVGLLTAPTSNFTTSMTTPLGIITLLKLASDLFLKKNADAGTLSIGTTDGAIDGIVKAATFTAGTAVTAPSGTFTTLGATTATIPTVNATNANIGTATVSTNLTAPVATITTVNAPTINSSTLINAKDISVTGGVDAAIVTANNSTFDASTITTLNAGTGTFSTSLSAPTATIPTFNSTTITATNFNTVNVTNTNTTTDSIAASVAGADISLSNCGLSNVKKIGFSSTNTTTSPILTSQLGSDTQPKYRVYAGGVMQLGTGTGTNDIYLANTGAGTLRAYTTYSGGVLSGNAPFQAGDITGATLNSSVVDASTGSFFGPLWKTNTGNMELRPFGGTVTVTGDTYTRGLNRTFGGATSNYYSTSCVLYKQPSVFSFAASAGVQTVWTITIPIGTLLAYGDGVRIYCSGKTSATAGVKALRFSVNANNYDSPAFTSSVSNPISFDAFITRGTTSTQFNLSYKYYENETLKDYAIAENITCNNWDSATNTIAFKASSDLGTVNEIVIRHSYCELL